MAAVASSQEVDSIEVNLTPRTCELLNFALQYWDSKRGSATVPDRADIDPLEMKPILPWICLIDVEDAPLDFRIRLGGTGVCDAHGREITGLLARELGWEDYGEVVWRHCAEVHDRRCPVVRQIGLMRDAGAHTITRMLLPLSVNETDSSMLMSVDRYDGHPKEIRRLLANPC